MRREPGRENISEIRDVRSYEMINPKPGSASLEVTLVLQGTEMEGIVGGIADVTHATAAPLILEACVVGNWQMNDSGRIMNITARGYGSDTAVPENIVRFSMELVEDGTGGEGSFSYLENGNWIESGPLEIIENLQQEAILTEELAREM